MTLFWSADLKLLAFSANIEIKLVLVWAVEVNLIFVLGIEIDLISSQGSN